MKITQLLDRPIAYHRVFVTLTGSVKAAILLSQAMYWQQRAKQKDGWWYKSADEWEEETGLTRHEQQTARKDCEPFLMADLRGVPATLYWKVNETAIEQALFDESGKSSLADSVKLDLLNQSNINKNAENTTENTTERVEKTITEQADQKMDAILNMLGMPGLKKEQRILQYESLIKIKTGLNPQRKKWQDLWDFVDKQPGQGVDLEKFIIWLTSQPKFDASYWPPEKMQEHWHRAFMAQPVQKPTYSQRLPSGV